jgi:hypothetical protein
MNIIACGFGSGDGLCSGTCYASFFFFFSHTPAASFPPFCFSLETKILANGLVSCRLSWDITNHHEGALLTFALSIAARNSLFDFVEAL